MAVWPRGSDAYVPVLYIVQLLQLLQLPMYLYLRVSNYLYLQQPEEDPGWIETLQTMYLFYFLFSLTAASIGVFQNFILNAFFMRITDVNNSKIQNLS